MTPFPTRWLLLSLAILGLDQLTKAWVLHYLPLGSGLAITSFFNLVHVANPGAAFSFLAGAGGWQRWFFLLLTAVAVGVLLQLLRKSRGQTGYCLALALVLGGALGNGVDRLLYGHVVDFLQFHWGFLSPLFPGGYFPSFNVADSAITVGAIGLLWHELRKALA